MGVQMPSCNKSARFAAVKAHRASQLSRLGMCKGNQPPSDWRSGGSPYELVHIVFKISFWLPADWSILGDPRNRNHKSLAIANHNFEVASFSRRYRSKIAVLEVFSESQ